LIHRFLDRGSWLSLLLAMNLLALQTIGNMPYFIPMTSLVVALHFGLYTAFNWRTQLISVRRLRFGLPAVLTVLVGLGGLAASFLILHLGSEEIAKYSPGRDLDGSVSLETFLTYGGEITARKWTEAFLGVSPSLDNTLYMGLLTLPLLAAGYCLSQRRRYAHVHLLCAVLLLFGLGWIIAPGAYRWWPFMKYYRHIGLTGSVTRVFLCFAAGCGFEAVFLGHETKRRLRALAVLFAAGMSVLAVGLFYLAVDTAFAQRILMAMHTHMPTSLYAASPSPCPVIFEPHILQSRLIVSGCLALLGGVLLAGRGLLSKLNTQKTLATAALALIAVDVYIYKYSEAWLRTNRLPSEKLDLLAFQKQPFRSRRSLTFFPPNPRVEVLLRDFAFAGLTHWSTSPFAFVDEVGSSFRVDYWQLPLDRFLRLWRGQDINDRSVPVGGLSLGASLEFPPQEGAQKLGGVTAHKVQFFRRAQVLCNSREVAARMSDPHYRGDALFVSTRNESAPPEEGTASPPPYYVSGDVDETTQPSADDRVELEYSVEQFDSNNFELKVRNTTGSPVWLLYSDVWHPGWSATVNGQDVQVYRGALAYKAVQLPPESSRVHFCFALPGVSSLYFFFGFCSVLWLGVLAVLVIRTCRGGTDGTDASQDQAVGLCPSLATE
jgi:hypothetical protein